MLIYSYSKMWKVEKKLYSIQNIVLPIPVDLLRAGYIIMFVLIVYILGQLIHPIQNIPVIIRYAIIPYFLAELFLNQKLDGKSPQKFFIDYILFLFTKGVYIEHFRSFKIENKKKAVRLDWKCSVGYAERG